MKILVNGKQAVMKEGSSFEYHSENPLFTDAEDYSMDIEFPMKDCPQNILIFGALHVKGVDISTVSFPCEIITASFDKTGILTITEVGSEVVKGQFLEGMSQQNFAFALPSTYITDIDFSDYDGTDGTQESYDRFMGAGWGNMIVYDENKQNFIYFQQGAAGAGGYTCRHIYLYHLLYLVALKCGYTLDDAALRTVPMYTKICIVNTGYVVWDRHGYDAFPSLARSLPHWTVRELLDEVGKFFGCVYEIDSISHKIMFKSYKQLTSTGQGGQRITLTVIDDFGVEMTDEDAKYKGNVKLKIADEADPEKLNMCPWLFDKHYLYSVSTYTSAVFRGILKAAEWSQSAGVQALSWGDRTLYYLSDLDAYAVLTKIKEYMAEGAGEFDPPNAICAEYEIINQWGDFREGDELGICPCPLKVKRLGNEPNTDASQGSSYPTLGYAYKVPVISIPKDRQFEFWDREAPVDPILDVLKDGEFEEVEYFKKLFVVIHSGTMDKRGYYLNTRKLEPEGTDDIMPHGDFSNDDLNYSGPVHEYDYNLCPSDPSILAISDLPRVDETKLYRYKFLSKTLPDPKAIYVIQGKEYACLRITAHFTVDGMSDELEGEFYEIVG